jgi:hypothetical protein
MTWEQKLAALQAIAPTTLNMRKPGDWYVSAQGRDVGGDGLLTASYGNGKTPQEAVEDDWRQVAELPFDKYVVVFVRNTRKHLRWNGYMWSDLTIEPSPPKGAA